MEQYRLDAYGGSVPNHLSSLCPNCKEPYYGEDSIEDNPNCGNHESGDGKPIHYKLTPLSLGDFFYSFGDEVKIWPRTPAPPKPDVMITPAKPIKRQTWRDKLKALWPWK